MKENKTEEDDKKTTTTTLKHKYEKTLRQTSGLLDARDNKNLLAESIIASIGRYCIDLM